MLTLKCSPRTRGQECNALQRPVARASANWSRCFRSGRNVSSLTRMGAPVMEWVGSCQAFSCLKCFPQLERSFSSSLPFPSTWSVWGAGVRVVVSSQSRAALLLVPNRDIYSHLIRFIRNISELAANCFALQYTTQWLSKIYDNRNQSTKFCWCWMVVGWRQNFHLRRKLHFIYAYQNHQVSIELTQNTDWYSICLITVTAQNLAKFHNIIR